MKRLIKMTIWMAVLSMFAASWSLAGTEVRCPWGDQVVTSGRMHVDVSRFPHEWHHPSFSGQTLDVDLSKVAHLTEFSVTKDSLTCTYTYPGGQIRMIRDLSGEINCGVGAMDAANCKMAGGTHSARMEPSWWTCAFEVSHRDKPLDCSPTSPDCRWLSGMGMSCFER